jgi:signal transduction histidine kinase
MFVVAGGLLALIVALAARQYRGLGQISQAERDRLSATLRTNAASFAEDVDREVNRAYLLFQAAPPPDGQALGTEIGGRYDRWQATSRFPRLIKDVYVAAPANGAIALQRFNPSTRLVQSAEWPAALAPIRARLARAAPLPEPGARDVTVIHSSLPTFWPDVPALVLPAPLLFVNRPGAGITLPAAPSYSILLLDADYVAGEMLPSLARHYFQGAGGDLDYEVAVVPTDRDGPIYHSTDGFRPAADAKVDASADLFYLRLQDFAPLAAEISRFTVLSTLPGPRGAAIAEQTERIVRQTVTTSPGKGQITIPQGTSMSVFVQESDGRGGTPTTMTDKLVTTGTASNGRFAFSTTPRWRLLVKHPSGSLEQAVDRARHRNLFISTAVLGLLAVSIGFLVVSTRRAHDLARRQLEFVATVSHELRTPLAVIRSAADNLADGIVGDEARVRQYGQLVRNEGVRLTDLVEQILEYAGLQSGSRVVSRTPVTIEAVLRDAAGAVSGDAADAGVRVEIATADALPAVAADGPALRRVFLNLIGNAVKYGAGGGWVGIRATAANGGVDVTVSDRGIGIAPAEQHRIFEPFYRAPEVVAAQIQGAGLGLSLVKRIVEAHAGHIALESTPGKGSTFVVTLPVFRGDAADGPERVADAAPQPS